MIYEAALLWGGLVALAQLSDKMSQSWAFTGTKVPMKNRRFCKESAVHHYFPNFLRLFFEGSSGCLKPWLIRTLRRERLHDFPTHGRRKRRDRYDQHNTCHAVCIWNFYAVVVPSIQHPDDKPCNAQRGMGAVQGETYRLLQGYDLVLWKRSPPCCWIDWRGKYVTACTEQNRAVFIQGCRFDLTLPGWYFEQYIPAKLECLPIHLFCVKMQMW